MNRWTRHDPVRIIPIRTDSGEDCGCGGLCDTGQRCQMPKRLIEWYAVAYFRDGSPAHTGPVKQDRESAIHAVATWLNLAGWRSGNVLVFTEDR